MWDTIGYIASSKYRESIFLELNLHRRTPKELSELTNIALPNVTRALKELEEMGLVKCLNPDYKRGRLYVPTDIGKQIFEVIEKEPRFQTHLSTRFEYKIEQILNKNDIEYYRDYILPTQIIDIHLDFFIPGEHKNIVIYTKFFRDDRYLKHIRPIINQIGFESAEITKKFKDVSIVLYLGGSIKVIESLMGLKYLGYVTEIFKEGEEERLLEFIKSRINPESPAF